MENDIQIVDRGRGPQLSTNRITVQDVVPYWQKGFTPQEMMRAMPILTAEEIRTIARYIEEHREAVLEEDRRIRAENATRRNSPEVEKILQEAHARRLGRSETRRKSTAQE